MPSLGLLNYGVRYKGAPFEAKGKGYFGPLPHGDQVSTEISADSNLNGKEVSYPLLVPGLRKSHIEHLLAGKDPTPEIYAIAEDYAKRRLAGGRSPFASLSELRASPEMLNAFPER